MSKLYDKKFAEDCSLVEMSQVDRLNLALPTNKLPCLRFYQARDNLKSRDAFLILHEEYRQEGSKVATIELEHNLNGEPDSFKTFKYLNIPTRKLRNNGNLKYDIYIKSSVDFKLWFLVTSAGILEASRDNSIAVISKNENNILKRKGITGDNDFLKIYNNTGDLYRNAVWLKGFRYLIDKREACLGNTQDISNYLMNRYLK